MSGLDEPLSGEEVKMLEMSVAELEKKKEELSEKKKKLALIHEIRKLEAETDTEKMSEKKREKYGPRQKRAPEVESIDEQDTDASDVRKQKASLAALLDEKARKQPGAARGGKAAGASARQPVSASSSASSSSAEELDDLLAPSWSARGKRYKKKRVVKSGLKDRLNTRVVSKQKYPHAFLKPECLLGRDTAADLKYSDLSLGLFFAGELEIIMGEKTPEDEKLKRLELLLATAYRSEYIEWAKLLHVQRSILSRIEKGTADWKSDFVDIEHHVLTIMGSAGKKVTPATPEKSDAKAVKQSKTKHGSGGAAAVGLLYCSRYQGGNCTAESDPHMANMDGVQREVHHVCASCLKQGKSERHNRAGCPLVKRSA